MRFAVTPVIQGIDPMTVPGLAWAFRARDLAVADGAPVPSWVDAQSGLNLVQATGSRQPPWHADGGYGFPVVRFSAAAFQSLAGSSSALAATSRTIIAVLRSSNDGTTQTVMGVGASSWRVGSNANGRMQHAYSDASAVTQTRTVTSGRQFDGLPFVAAWRVGTSGLSVRSVMRKNGVLRHDSTLATGSATPGSSPRIGGAGATTTNYTGDVGELYAWPLELTDAQTVGVCRWLAQANRIPTS